MGECGSVGECVKMTFNDTCVRENNDVLTPTDDCCNCVKKRCFNNNNNNDNRTTPIIALFHH